MTRPPYESPPNVILEAHVAALVRAGDLDRATTAVLRALGSTIRRFLSSSLRDERDAADAFSLFQEALWRGLPTFRGDSSLRTWALRIAFHAALHIRNEAWRQRVRRLATSEMQAIPQRSRTRSSLRMDSAERWLENVRRTLSFEDQAMLSLRVDQRLPWAQIAEVLADRGEDVTIAALCKRFERLKRRLAQAAREEGLLAEGPRDTWEPPPPLQIAGNAEDGAHRQGRA